MEKLNLERINIQCVSQFPVDYMHCVLLGVVRQSLKHWVHIKKKDYSLNKYQINMINNRLQQIKTGITSEFARKPRPLYELERWKATEFRLFVLYTGVVVLRNILPIKYYEHFLLLVCAMRILCDKKQCTYNNECATNMLRKYVQNFSELYGTSSVGYNVHNLIHLSADVKKYG